MTSPIDGSLYPDQDTPDSLEGLDERVDFLARLCSAWDFGILPGEETVVMVRDRSWRVAVDSCRLLTSPAYHLLRRWHALPKLPYLGQSLGYIREDPNLLHV